MSLIISGIHLNSYIPNGVALVFSPRESFPSLATATAATTSHIAAANTRSQVTKGTPAIARGARMKSVLAMRLACMSIATSRLPVRS